MMDEETAGSRPQRQIHFSSENDEPLLYPELVKRTHQKIFFITNLTISALTMLSTSLVAFAIPESNHKGKIISAFCGALVPLTGGLIAQYCESEIFRRAPNLCKAIALAGMTAFTKALFAVLLSYTGAICGIYLDGKSDNSNAGIYLGVTLASILSFLTSSGFDARCTGNEKTTDSIIYFLDHSEDAPALAELENYPTQTTGLLSDASIEPHMGKPTSRGRGQD